MRKKQNLFIFFRDDFFIFSEKKYFFSIKSNFERIFFTFPKHLAKKKIALKIALRVSFPMIQNFGKKKVISVAASSFDLPTFGLWAQHASTAPSRVYIIIISSNNEN